MNSNLILQLVRRGTLSAASFAVAAAVIAIAVGCPSEGKLVSAEDRISRFKSLYEALYTFDEHNGKLPDAVKCDEQGRMLHSWRSSVLPFAEGVKDLLDLEAPWDAPSNRQLAENAISLYCDRSNPNNQERFSGVVSAIVGRDTPLRRFIAATGGRALRYDPAD